MIKKLYRTNEFAKLCGVTRHTLYHYDEIGLLTPGIIHENGYRYYTIDQFETFNIISVLKKAGASLEEIRQYLNDLDTDTFLNVLHTKLTDLKKEAEKIEKMCSMLETAITATETHLHTETEKIEIINCEEEYLIATRLPCSSKDEKTMLKGIGSHLQYCLMHNYNFHVGEIILEKDVEQNLFSESYYYSRIENKTDDERLFIKPKGSYAVMYHQGNYDSLYQTYQNMKKRLEAQGYHIIGNIYEEDMIDYLSEHNAENYIQKISVQVMSPQCTRGHNPLHTEDMF